MSKMGKIGTLATVLGSAAMFTACEPQANAPQQPRAPESAAQEPNFGETGNGIRKGRPGATPGDGDYCGQAPASQCVAGEGDCDANAECTGGTVCVSDVGDRFGFAALGDVCLDSSCTDRSACGPGSICGPCTCPFPNGDVNHCTPECKCTVGEGDCDKNADCAAGLACVYDKGAQFGLGADIDLCLPAHCGNRKIDADETGVDCGGSCGSCVGFPPGVLLFGDQDDVNGGAYPSDPTAGTAMIGLVAGAATSSPNTYGAPFPQPFTGADFPGTDQVFVGSNQANTCDGYSGDPNRGPALVTALDYSALVPAGATVTSITLGIMTNDFQNQVWGDPFSVTINGVTQLTTQALLNNLDQTGPITQFITVGLDPSLDDPSHTLNIVIDEAFDGCDGFLVDFFTVGVETI